MKKLWKRLAMEDVAEEQMEGAMLKKHPLGKGKKVFFLLLAVVLFFGCIVYKNRNTNYYRYMDMNHLSSYEDLYKHYMDLMQKQDRYVLERANNMNTYLSSSLNDGAGMAVSDSSTGVSGYSSMNVREENVGEADYAVTDGKYIYTVEHDGGIAAETDQHLWLHIFKAQGEETKEVSKKEIPLFEGRDNASFTSAKGEVYVFGDVLVVLQDVTMELEWDARTVLFFYDISNPEKPKMIHYSEQYGAYNTCREINGILYVITLRTNIPVTSMKEEQMERYVPYSDEGFLAPQDIYMTNDSQGNAYSMIGSWSLEEEGKMVDAKALVGYDSYVYVTDSNLYLCGTVYGDTQEKSETDNTRLTKFRLENGTITAETMTSVKGGITDSFSLQEKGKYLDAIVYTHHYVYGENDAEETVSSMWTDIGAYVFDGNMKMVSRLEGLEKDESIEAVRFVDDICYLVSYQKTDPLVSIDFSNPKRLKVLDELEMPGYSSYLHPVADDLLLGIGRDEDDQIKLALYDISDEKNLQEYDVKTIGGIEASAALEDYKKVFVDEENQIIGFGGYQYDDCDILKERYVLYHYDRDTKLTKIKQVEVPRCSIHEEQYFFLDQKIGLRIGSWFYVVSPNTCKKKYLVSFPYL